MAMLSFPPCPAQLKSVQHYLKLAIDYDNRDQFISYWARVYALQTALKIDRKSPEARNLLTALMDYLEEFKKSHSGNEEVTSDITAQAIIENEAHKLFCRADAADRASQHDKNVVKTFYTAGILMDIIEVFGALPEELASQRKYSKWKATYIHNCLRDGQAPIPGPIGGDDYFQDDAEMPLNQPNAIGDLPAEVNLSPNEPQSFPPAASQQGSVNSFPHPVSSEGSQITPDALSKAQKYCKFASSSLEYEDVNTAIEYLQKALSLLTTGRES